MEQWELALATEQWLEMEQWELAWEFAPAAEGWVVSQRLVEMEQWKLEWQGLEQWRLAPAAEVTCQRLAEMGLELVLVAVAELWVTCQSLA